MKNTLKVLGVIAFIAVIGFTMIACNKSSGSSSNSSKSSGGGKSLNSPEALKEYLDSQPANSPNNPIKVSMGANELMLPKIKDVLNSTGKYVSLNLTGNALTEIPSYAFEDCKTLVNITIPNSVTNIGYQAFKNCTKLTSVTIPNSVTNIGYQAFENCTNLTSVTIPDSVTSIENYAFEGSGLTSITIPANVTSIGWDVFADCENLTKVTFQGKISTNNYELVKDTSPRDGDLREKYLAGGIGTYTTTAPVNDFSKWTKQ